MYCVFIGGQYEVRVAVSGLAGCTAFLLVDNVK